MLNVDYTKITEEQLIESYLDPVKYCEHFLDEFVTVEMALDPESPFEYANAPIIQQRRILRDIAKYKFVSIAGSNTFGKSHLMVRIASWWIDRYDECLIIVISPRADQIQKNFAIPFSEIRGVAGEMPDKENVFAYMPDASNKKKQIFYTTAAKQESIAGWHAFDNKLFLFDEASGIHNDIYAAVFPMANRRDSKWVLFSNPLRDMDEINYNRFYESSNSKNWVFHSLSAFDHPNYIHKKYVIERGMDPNFPETAAEEYGEDSVEYKARVLGQFALATTQSLYAQWIDDIFVETEDWIDNVKYRYRTIGIDPAGKRSGDSTVFTDYRFDLRTGESAEIVFSEERADDEDILGFLREITSDGSVNAIGVDVRGLGNFLPALIKNDDEIDVDYIYEYDGVVKAEDEERYDSKKDEDSFDLQDRMKHSVNDGRVAHSLRIKKDPILYREMGTRRFGTHKNRRKLVEKKAGTGESPDHFESLLVARDAMKLYLAEMRRQGSRNASRALEAANRQAA